MKKTHRKSRSLWIDSAFSIAIILFTLIAIYLISINLKEQPEPEQVVTKNAKPNPVTTETIDSTYPGIKIITQTSNDSFNPFAIQYPQSVHKQFNDEISLYINVAKENYLKAMTIAKSNELRNNGELNISFQTFSHKTGNYSFVLVKNKSITETDTQIEIRSFHLNPETGDQITLKEIVGSNLDHLYDISKLVRSNLQNDPTLRNKLSEDAVIQKTTPAWENFTNFALTDDVLIFYFDEKELTETAIGPSIVSIPLVEINSILAPDFKVEEVQENTLIKENDQTSEKNNVVNEPTKDTSIPANPTPSEKETDDRNTDASTSSDSEMKDDDSKVETSNGKRVALTFDDGPDPKTTTQILATLAKYDAKATFFMLGSRVEYYPEIAKNVQLAGHQLGNHTWNHPDLTKATIEKIGKEINNTSAIIEKVTGQKATVFRPPYGAVNSKIRAQTALPIILWSVDTLDWKHRDSTKLLQIVQQKTKDGGIILMHDIHQSTADGLDMVLAYLKQEGYSFVTISELNN